jgi:phosphate uptake regulator
MPRSAISGGYVVHSEFDLSIQTLGLNLLDMGRITQRSVDRAIGAIQQGNPDLIGSARDGVYEIQILHSDISEIAHDLLMMRKMPRGKELRFVLSSTRICDSLQAIHNNAVESASNTMRFWGNGGEFEGTDFGWMGDGVNRLVECCAASLIDENVEPAEIVLGTDYLEKEFVDLFHDWYVTTERPERAQAKWAFAVARNLRQMVHHAREIADALVFWLGDGRSTAESGEIAMIDQVPR